MGTWMETQISIYRERSVDKFEYLGYILAENGYLDAEKTHRIQSGWRNWNRVLESMWVKFLTSVQLLKIASHPVYC